MVVFPCTGGAALHLALALEGRESELEAVPEVVASLVRSILEYAPGGHDTWTPGGWAGPAGCPGALGGSSSSSSHMWAGVQGTSWAGPQRRPSASAYTGVPKAAAHSIGGGSSASNKAYAANGSAANGSAASGIAGNSRTGDGGTGGGTGGGSGGSGNSPTGSDNSTGDGVGRGGGLKRSLLFLVDQQYDMHLHEEDDLYFS